MTPSLGLPYTVAMFVQRLTGRPALARRRLSRMIALRLPRLDSDLQLDHDTRHEAGAPLRSQSSRALQSVRPHSSRERGGRLVRRLGSPVLLDGVATTTRVRVTRVARLVAYITRSPHPRVTVLHRLSRGPSSSTAYRPRSHADDRDAPVTRPTCMRDATPPSSHGCKESGAATPVRHLPTPAWRRRDAHGAVALEVDSPARHRVSRARAGLTSTQVETRPTAGSSTVESSSAGQHPTARGSHSALPTSSRYAEDERLIDPVRGAGRSRGCRRRRGPSPCRTLRPAVNLYACRPEHRPELIPTLTAS
jgi:hypothetical protein